MIVFDCMCNTQKFFVIELYCVQLSGSWIPSSTLALIVPASFKAAGHRSIYFRRLQLEHVVEGEFSTTYPYTTRHAATTHC